MRCENEKCRWNNKWHGCGYPYDISINEDGYCNEADEILEEEDEEEVDNG